MGRVALWEALKLEDSETLDYQVMHAPYGNDGTKGEVLYINTLGIASTSKNKEAAMEFVKYVTSEEGLRILLENTSDPQIAVRKSLKRFQFHSLMKVKMQVSLWMHLNIANGCQMF